MGLADIFQKLGLDQQLAQNASNQNTQFNEPNPIGFGSGTAEEIILSGAPFDSTNRLEQFSVRNERNASTGAFRGFIDQIEATARREGVEDRAAEARGLASRVADVDRGTFNRSTATLSLTDRQRAAANRRLGLRRAVAQADAGSTVRRVATDAANAARNAGASLADLTFGQTLAGLTAAANEEGQRRARRAQEEAADDANRNGLIGSVVGAGLSLFSSETLKDKVGKEKKLLDRLNKVRVEKWRYKEDTGLDQNDHIGVYAEEFNDTFGVGQKNRGMVSLIDLLGVSLGAIKELDQKVEALRG